MGNNPSGHSKSGSASPAGPTDGQHRSTQAGSAGGSERRREPKLRESVHGQKGAPPESSQVQARGTTTHRTRPSQGQPSPQPPSYAQAQAQSHSNSPSHPQSHSPRQYSPYPPQPLTQSQNASPANNTPYSNSPKERVVSQHQQPQAQKTRSDENRTSKSNTPPQYKDQPSKPVAVPQPVNTSATTDSSDVIRSPLSPYGAVHTEHAGVADTMSYHLTRPPRLPLPIEEEVHTPGSPILGPADAQAPLPELDPLEMGEVLTRPLSPTETEDEDGEELPVDRSKPTVRTLFTWHGDEKVSKVYVTGTIFQWSRKHKLNPVPEKPGYFEGIVNVRPGTHHIRFIVDGNMSLSPDLPTTVDFGNNLVNYIEVSADDAQPAVDDHEQSQQSIHSQHGHGEHDDSHHDDSQESPSKQPPPQRTRPVPSRDQYTSQIPQYLLDLDKAEDSREYQYAAAAIVKLPTPPSLPGFLGKPILNAATPMKDDNSVLNMPNHTVLNHLATSSIKGNVLAVSATTRYKRKYVTTIMYKPTSDDTT